MPNPENPDTNRKEVDSYAPRVLMTNPLPNHLNIQRRCEKPPSEIDSTASQSVALTISQVIIQPPDSG